MSEDHRKGFERFECAPALQLEAFEKLANLHYERLEEKIQKLEENAARSERRIWMVVSGVAGTVVAQLAQRILEFG